MNEFARRGYRKGRKEGRLEGRLTGRLEGKEEGRLEGEVAIVRRQLARKFGILPEELLESIGQLSLAQVEELGDAILEFKKPNDLAKWLGATVHAESEKA